MPTARHVATFVVTVGLILIGWTSGCGSNPGQGNGDDGGPGSSGSGSGGQGTGNGGGGITGIDATVGATNICTADGSACVATCRYHGKTTLTGRVFDPAGKNPLWNVQVYVPYQQPGPMPAGPICNCSEVFTGRAIAAAQTDATGTFTIGDDLTPAPGPTNGSTIPIVVQVGKWRYQTRVTVECGVENKVPDGRLRLPDGRTGSTDPNVQFPGDLPDIAISTGGCDSLECLLRRVGVQASEYVSGAGSPGDGHIHIYAGSPSGSAPNTSPPAPQSSTSLWANAQQLMAYDVVLLSCEGNETTGAVPSSLASYIKMGGRAFASHYHYNWFVNPNTGASADPTFSNFGTWFTAHVNAVEGPVYGLVQTTLPNGVPFPEGAAMKQWLNTVGATPGAAAATGDGGGPADGGDAGDGGGSGNAGGSTGGGGLPIFQARHNVDVYYPQVAVPWMDFDPTRVSWPAGLQYDPVSANSTLYLSWDSTSANGAAETSCGRVVYSDLHVGGNSGDYGASPSDTCTKWNGQPVPTGCNTTVDLSAQEKALEFMLFDLTGCLAPPGVDAGVQVSVAR